MSENADRITWLRSKEVRKALRISTCHLAHMRTAGKLRFRKNGNAFLYDSKDVAREADHFRPNGGTA